MADIRQNPQVFDSFTRPSYPVDPIDGNWTGGVPGLFGPMSIISPGVATHYPGQTEGAGYWTAATYDGDDAECWAFGVGGSASGIAFRLWLARDVGSSATIDGYRASTIETSGSTSKTIVRYDNGVPTTLNSTGSAPTSSPGYFLLRRNGGDVELWWDQSVAQDGSDFTLLISATDSAYTTGLSLGIAVTDNSASQILGWTDFGGGPALPFRPQIYRIIKGFDQP